MLDAWSAFLQIEKMADRSEQVADLMIGGAVIGWVQGRSELGSKALGNRSIVADPRGVMPCLKQRIGCCRRRMEVAPSGS